MPIYEYRCHDCGKVVEAMQKMSDPPLDICGDQCASAAVGEGRLEKLISAANFGRGLTSGRVISDTGASAPMTFKEAASCGSCGRAPGSCATD